MSDVVKYTLTMKNLLIIGGGNMGFAIAAGITQNKIFKKSNIIIVEKKSERIRFLKKQKFIVLKSASQALKKYKNTTFAILLSVKPQEIKITLEPVKDLIPRSTLVISIAAGVKLKDISLLLNKNQPLTRVMPNTPCQVGHGMSVLSFNKAATKNHRRVTHKIFNSIGETIELRENNFDLVGSIVGSGPAYFTYLIESLVHSGVKLGLKPNIASKLVLQTSLGTNLLLHKKNLSPEVLRKAVTSPRGITEAALKIYQKRRFADIVHQGVLAAKNRSVGLGKQK